MDVKKKVLKRKLEKMKAAQVKLRKKERMKEDQEEKEIKEEVEVHDPEQESEVQFFFLLCSSITDLRLA
ncbi:unnamed protein product [Angiostrongylus costaricensis]|uniref:GN3L_Grn1 domain-containing protein n=1 Tax=Angiostrongylus costaricensis TaxID=334426 RepID=A0A0R3PHV6_ANGCS|nr:unnamed protein product [Angiostrongylus costaricensis]